MSVIFQAISACEQANRAKMEAEGDLDMLEFFSKSERAAEIEIARATTARAKERLRAAVAHLRTLVPQVNR